MNKKIYKQKQKVNELFLKIVKKTLIKPENLTVSQWAERYRVLDETSVVSGRWSNEITPYLIEIMNSFNDPYIEHITFCKPTQVGGTEALLNMLGYIISQNPSPTMIVYPTDDLAKDISKDKLKPAVRNSPELRNKFYELKSKELNLKFQGMNLYLNGSNSPSKLASKAIKYLFFDEIDKMEGTFSKEASPYNLALERTKTFRFSRKIYVCSTPTLKTNYIWKLHEQADEQRHYFVPCPHCGEFIELKWSQIKFDKDEEKKMSITDRAKTAIYMCQVCNLPIENQDKPKMLRNGEWRSVVKKTDNQVRKISFWLNSLYSIFVSWEDVALEFLRSKDEPEQLQNFVNSWLAEPWEETENRTSSDTVLERQTNCEEFIVPDWAKFLTAGVDVQENCIYYTIRAWGNNITSQNITHGQVLGLNEIENIMNLEYKKIDGTSLVVNLCVIDSGFRTDDIYDFCANNCDWALAGKGSSTTMLSHYKFSKVNKVLSQQNGINLLMIDSGKYKDMIAARMLKPNGIGSFMTYKGCDVEYAKQITSEHKVFVKKGTKKTKIWQVKVSHADNHYLDCEVYAFAAADVLGVRTLHLQHQESMTNS